MAVTSVKTVGVKISIYHVGGPKLSSERFKKTSHTLHKFRFIADKPT
jgi:hypothetical protein